MRKPNIAELRYEATFLQQTRTVVDASVTFPLVALASNPVSRVKVNWGGVGAQAHGEVERDMDINCFLDMRTRADLDKSMFVRLAYGSTSVLLDILAIASDRIGGFMRVYCRESLPRFDMTVERLVSASGGVSDGSGGYSNASPYVATGVTIPMTMSATATDMRFTPQIVGFDFSTEHETRYFAEYSTDLTENDRLVYNGRYFYVRGIFDPGNRHERIVVCSQEDNRA